MNTCETFRRYVSFRKLTHLMQNPELHHLAQLNNNTFDHTSKSPLVLIYQKEKLQPLTVSITIIAKHYPSIPLLRLPIPNGLWLFKHYVWGTEVFYCFRPKYSILFQQIWKYMLNLVFFFFFFKNNHWRGRRACSGGTKNEQIKLPFF